VKTLGIYLASDFNSTVEIGGQNFWDTGLGTILRTALGVVGIIVVIIALLNIVKSIASGRIGAAVKSLIGAVILAAFLFNPGLINQVIEASGGFVSTVIDTIKSVGDSGTSS